MSAGFLIIERSGRKQGHLPDPEPPGIADGPQGRAVHQGKKPGLQRVNTIE